MEIVCVVNAEARGRELKGSVGKRTAAHKEEDRQRGVSPKTLDTGPLLKAEDSIEKKHYATIQALIALFTSLAFVACVLLHSR